MTRERSLAILPRDEFFQCCPDHLTDQMRNELLEWAGGDTCELVDYTTDNHGRIDSESSPRPAD